MSLHRDQFGYVDLPDPIASAEAAGVAEDPPPARVTLKVSGGLRSEIDRAAAREGVSPDSWLLMAISRSLSSSGPAAA